ncbi:unnamed protein product [Pneumocystis jirovecii]|uniref:Protein YIP n=1 Tax=Pneumocystis jirovecii TaxID=42068 RepID=L0P9D5_PNEJI|nr:unnamed protein product [Pneumocystis jirovecii]
MTENEDINSNLFIHMNIPETKAETIFENITGEYASNRRYASGDTLEESIYMAIYNDIKMIGIKLRDLWGPLIFCLILSSCLSLTAPKSESTIIFTSIFCVVWISELIIALNLKLLGAPITRSLFQSISVLGYSLFPFMIITITNLFINTVFIKFSLIIIAYTWSTYASLSVIRNFSLTKKRLLAIYPLFLYYFSWIIFLQSI